MIKRTTTQDFLEKIKDQANQGIIEAYAGEHPTIAKHKTVKESKQ